MHIDISSISTELLDRVLRAKPKDFPTNLLEAAARWMYGYSAKLAHPQNRPHHPPDPYITAQFLAVAPWPQLERLLYQLMAERAEPGGSYGWFVTVACNRIHGFRAETVKERRAQLRVVKPSSPAPPPPEQQSLIPDPEFSAGLIRQVAAAVGGLHR